ncbi:hypothetical protein BDS110ZK4_35430 [Bradyrhizobium diazoefficiens]|uniref:Uncharacterized protein n=1 Tax=Bradyrhizobium diazoefficiens TaxID=1355477 RepID=A0A810BTY4_9BRAD|nr:hypothetical protein BDHH15_09410 [Bradyrhizobium diazoefficiens]BCE18290.1 hypothetical protein XF1B_09710 [Bradyrhizobium diazoefficiens]BCE27143.1 hypothetical protein XF2B_09120 [Bradyrhizobium diazoefficiens]BCE35910.1 hypothetical protein XF3B_09410 [Bradyrhizobium diazoefficiens]BCE44543.1 hypothetical protein XF4B_08920 [Bradyrhizobium diazoefficiens]
MAVTAKIPATSNTPHRVSHRTGPRRAKAAQPFFAAKDIPAATVEKTWRIPPPWRNMNTPHKWPKP